MKKKDLIFYAGAAVLMAVSAQGVSADELVSNEATTTEGNQVQAEKAPEVAVAEKSVAPIASNYAAPANVTEQPVAPASKVAASESGTPSVEKAVEASTTEKEETPLPSDTGSTTFFNTGTHAPAGRSTDVAVQPKSFVDVSSHNGEISIGDYRTLANKGVGGVVVKLTEDTWYKNPNAENQIRNAQAAGLQVSTYHFSRYTSEEAARTEARFYIAAAQRLNLPKNTLMVNDFEDAKMQPNINRTTQAWEDEMRKNGYTNLMFYTSASWLDENNLRKKGPVNTSQFGLQNFWVAQYPSPKLSVNDAKSLRYNGKAGAWQFTSQAELLPGKHLFDHSVDYTGRFTANAKPAADPTEGSLSGKIDIVNNDTMTGRFDVVISNVKAPNGVRTVSVPIWSETGGQDDLVWYTANRQANGTYTVNVKAADHKNSTGLYNIHLYYVQNNGQMTGVGGTTTTVAIGKKNQTPVSADLTIAKSEKDGTFTITAKNLQGFDGYKEVKIPFWSHANGMKDIIWYTPTRQADGSYTVTAKASDHENADGKYEAQVFYVDVQGQNKFVKKAFIDYKNQSRPTGTLLIQNNNKDTGTFDVIIKDVYSPKGVQTVQVPSWSDKDGQDDIRWYEATRQANGDYKVSVKASDHKNSTGKYHIHLYYIQNDGSRVGVGSTTTEVEFRNAQTKTQAAIKNVNSGAGTFTVTVDQAPQGRQIKNIRVAAWSKAHQENLYWYSATPTGMHTEITVSANNHGNEAGNYTTHVYVDYKDGGVEGFNLGQTALSPRNQKVNPQTTYYSQRDPRWGAKWYGVSNMDQSGCVPTSLAMAFTDILGREVLPTTVADYLYYNTNSFNKIAVAGTDADGLVAATKHWGLTSQMLTGKDAIAATLVSGKHVLAAVEESIFINAPYTHEIVLQGYDNGKTYVRDPFNPANNGWHSIDYIFSVKSTDPIDAKLGSPFFSVFA
mgnify:CR=1 FL=1